MKWVTLVGLSLCLLVLPAAAQPPVAVADLEPLVAELQAVVETGDRESFLALLTPDADRVGAYQFAVRALQASVSRAVVVGRFLAPIEDVPEPDRYRLTVDVFTEIGDQGQLQTWQLEVTRLATASGTPPGPWRIAGHDGPEVLDGLYHLTLNLAEQFDASGLVITAEDMELRMASGAAFVSQIASGATALVLVGDGTLVFSPAPEAERRQIEIFSGRETLETAFTHAFVRLNPLTFAARVKAALEPMDIDKKEVDQAQQIFNEFAGLTFVVELSDFSDRTWWLTPSTGNLVAEVRTKEYGDLTYTVAEQQAEDVSLYTRNPSRVIALYPSVSKRAEQGRYYSTGRGEPFDVLDYDINASLEPQGVGRQSIRARPTLLGCWFEATARLAIRVADEPLASMTLQLSDAFRVHSVSSRELGSLLFFRLSGRDDLIVNLPSEVPGGTEFTILVTYSGLLQADELEENWIGRMRSLDINPVTYGIPERRYLYTNSSHWYPHPLASDYATATMALTIPADYGVVASGDPDDENPPLASPEEPTGRRTFSFITVQPTRYLSCLVTRFASEGAPHREVVLEPAAPPLGPSDMLRASQLGALPGVAYDSLSLSVEANPFGRDRVDELAEESAKILRFYASLLGDIPYPTFTLALSDSRLPGGHSPAYFVLLNQPLPVHGRLMRTWRTDPVAFSNFPSFFLAHEIAHQWWGQAVGWKNYHDQWLSEGLAQYFAALYAREARGDAVFEDILAQLRRWSIRHTDQGPVSLGYRLGQLAEEPRVFRALVYNKGALVMHMLRRLVGDDVFFRGLRRFYRDMRFRPAGTGDLVSAFEAESGRSLETFFGRWIHEFDLPTLQFDYRTETRPTDASKRDVVLRFRQEGKLFEIPVTVTLNYRSGARDTIVVPVSQQTTELRVPLTEPLKNLEVNRDNAALAEIRD